MSILVCKVCGNNYTVKPYRATTSIVCSRSCNGKLNYDKNLRYIDHSYMIGNKYRKGIKTTHGYKEGHIPWNKGIKGIHLSPMTEFKNGQKGVTAVDVGTIMPHIDSNGTIRNKIKISNPTKWIYYSQYMWELHFGKLKKGYIIHHVDRNTLNDNIGNLVSVTRSKHLKIHWEQVYSKTKFRRRDA